MAARTKVNTNENVFDVQSLFSRRNEREGVWFEPMDCGIKFKILGMDSDEAVKASDEFSRESEKADLIEDKLERKNRYEEILTKRIADIVIDIQSADGKKLTIGNKSVTKEDIYEILFNAPAITTKIMEFHRTQESFLGNKKNS